MAELFRSEEIVGKTVVNADGDIIGEVSEVLVDADRWCVADVQVRIAKPHAKELGLRTPFFGRLLVLVGVDKINSISDQIVLAIKKSEFKDYVEERKEKAKNGED